MNTPLLTDIKLHKKSRKISLSYGNGEQFELSCELLRVLSPSAEVRGHGQGQAVLQTGKRLVNIQQVEPIGHYALKITFDDGHDSGLFTWDYLYDLCCHQQQYWDNYLQQLHHAGASRDPDVSVIKFIE
ncbi:gamma-butyrobetaine hydroxylase-like domain-containing protein [Zooshikella sp. RANM57]|uniref:gamma-butyrobetaine hydroxylase-like domain-containing protein n=1 Tax=Zooshikella sp. RANM57 TaxID=3425863 RepID=UPI003D6E3758